MPIALLKFPTDLLREVFKLCDPFELYLSKYSKRTQKSIKSGGTKNWKLQFCGGNIIVASVDGLHYNFGITENPDDYFKTQNAAGYGNYMSIEFGNPFYVFFYLIDTYRIRVVESLGIYFGSFDKLSNAARELIGRNIEIEQVHIGSNPEVKKIDKLMPLTNKMHVNQNFECLKKFPPKFRLKLDKFPKNILIASSFLFTIDQLLECTCVRIELWGSLLSNQDMDVFFQKRKKTRSFPNLRWLQIYNLVLTVSITPFNVIKDNGTVGLLRVEMPIAILNFPTDLLRDVFKLCDPFQL
ncbi:Protein CBG07994 [Caenorhabditis briggsae]|uniref:Protein CBG07994 n=1 Tax=Caenorhabditis briggsae TaxID=6238 RepID=A8X5J1_CAEBR|nr:Protein CBG07994 [Caenorhabditis briggsae]CAP27902.2 Protein CBG07994 [Caenorhabditis briggsae]